MRLAYRLVLLMVGFNLSLLVMASKADAQTRFGVVNRLLAATGNIERALSPDIDSVARPRTRSTRMKKAEIDALLYDAIIDRIGLPYRSSGIDDRGYDCSGFVWRVYQDAGIDFKRASARMLWESLPEPDQEEVSEFGTLVFFRELGHVGIVRDAFSFYHVSSSNGVERAFFSGYWGERVTGFRKIPLPERKVRPRN